MPVQLDGDLLRVLIEKRGGIAAFLEAWSATTATGDYEPDKATVHRWINGQMPKNADRLIRLATVLDVDPFSLLKIADQDIDTAADELLAIVQDGAAAPAPLKLLRDFFGRQKEWPPEALASTYFGRPWVVRDFDHDPKVWSNYYACFCLVGAEPIVKPQTYHFAFRNDRAFSGRWLDYGVVIRYGSLARLWHINGHVEERTYQECSSPTHVETWCGPGPATFRIAALHDFSLTVSHPENGSGQALRFPG